MRGWLSTAVGDGVLRQPLSRLGRVVRRRPRAAAVAAACAVGLGAVAAWALSRPPAFHEPASVQALAREIDRVVPAALREHRVPGATVAVVHGGRVRWSAAYGLADAGRRAPMRPDTVLQVASISKPVAAMTMLRLARAGRLDLDRPVEELTGGWRLPPSDFDPAGVTLRRLLAHTAGIGVPGYPGVPPGRPLPSTRESLAGASGGGRAVLEREPGTETVYSGGGYSIAQLAVEEATGEPFSASVAREVLGPLGMDASGFGCTTSETPGPRVGRGHGPAGRPLPARRFSDQAAAGLCSTAADLGRFAAALMDSPEGAAMATPLAGTDGWYGLGLYTRTVRGGVRRIWHDGSNPGYQGRLEAYPGRGWALVVLTNGDNGHAVLEEVTRLVLR